MKRAILSIFVIFWTFCAFPQEVSHYRTLSWNDTYSMDADGRYFYLPSFAGAVHERDHAFLPWFSEFLPYDYPEQAIQVELAGMIFETIVQAGNYTLSPSQIPTDEVRVDHQIVYNRKLPLISVKFLPFRMNSLTGFMEKLVQFDIRVTYTGRQASMVKSGNYTGSSVLSGGKWYRISVGNRGVHRITYQDIENLGMSPGSLDPHNIRVYGNGGAMLPEPATSFRHDDLRELAVWVYGEEDGRFDPGDYVLFFGESTVSWYFDGLNGVFRHKKNLYSDQAFYFITSDLGPGKRVTVLPQTTGLATHTVSRFDDFVAHEIDSVNLIKSGKEWYGEKFDLFTSMNIPLSLAGLASGEEAVITAGVAARSFIPSRFEFYNGSTALMVIPVDYVANSPNSYYARNASGSSTFVPAGGSLNIRVDYNQPQSGSVGWLNFMEISYRRNLSFPGGQMAFRDAVSAGPGNIAEFLLGVSSTSLQVWEVTDPGNAGRVEGYYSSGQFIFRMGADSIREYIAFDGTSYYTPVLLGAVPNQNLHAMKDVDMVILTHPLFRQEAERLADYHRTIDLLDVAVVEPDQVYNEFSSGAQDVTAIRDFMKMLYENSTPGMELRYLLLFGDASYDPKNRLKNNTNFIPVWQSSESLHTVTSYVTDDFYGCLDHTANDDVLDIGIGRFVVANLPEAKNAVDKVIHYASEEPPVLGDWRNTICLVADDEDSNLHFDDAEDLAQLISSMNSSLNLDKIYLDAYQQASTPGGEKYPGANEDINKRMERGALIVNYVGHGGEVGWAHERVLEIADITSWDNWNHLPVYVTATCEFSRYDDPGRISAGEFVFLNPNGGAVAMFTTSRATYAGSNAGLNKSFYNYALTRVNNEYLRMGDIIRLAKMDSGSNENGRKFVLLGDPALKIALPELQIITTAINDQPLYQASDTIRALSTVKISGEIHDLDGNLVPDFSGILYPAVFDKPSSYSTLGNDPNNSIPKPFEIQKNILFKGKATIANGKWSFTFIAPRDIAYQYDFGKLSYYAAGDGLDAAGSNFDVVMGGYDGNYSPDSQGPGMRLYMNDEHFRNGGITDENPVLLAYLTDESGINTAGTGIGHDIIAIVDGQRNYVLNDYYESDIDDYTGGVIRYPFFGLDAGRHTLTLKVWDIHNNSSTGVLEFVVAGSDETALEELLNFPNPFSESTVFSFEHNQPEQLADVDIEIYSIDGRKVRTIREVSQTGGYRFVSSSWDGTDEGGNRLQSGLYVYRIRAFMEDGTVTEKRSKLIMLR